MTNIKKVIAIALGTLSLLVNSLSLCASELGSLKGIKWKEELPPRYGEFRDMVYGRLARPTDFNGDYVSWDLLATQLKQNGVKAVAFRIDKVSRYIPEDGHSQAEEAAHYHKQVRLVTKELEKEGIKVILWARIWLTNMTDYYVLNLFDTYLKSLSETERNQIDGIALTEIQISEMDELKTRAIGIATQFDERYPGWLKQRIFIMPGLDDGFRFTEIDKRDDFHSKVNELVGEFAFAAKSMRPKKPKSKGDHEGIYEKFYEEFDKYIEKPGATVVKREHYIRDKMNLDRLVAYQKSALANYPDMANIVYWGDSGDAMLTVNPKAAQALHNVLNQYGGKNNRGAFFYEGVGGDNMLKHTIAQSLIWYDKVLDTYTRNPLEYGKWENVMGVYDQWNSWFSDMPSYDGN